MANAASTLGPASPSSQPKNQGYHDQFPLVLADNGSPCPLSAKNMQ